ncbi:lipocalin family protein [Francisella tularensis]|uniref:lipocalin family protein n=1 Tax=Francisella tularensis TaxID=263 RepID=UPI000173E4E8|nr:lipocalin family protein [Francisella tularensis]ACD31444.1 outer membrane lipoprotein blc [Francisella tularensis subsp. mediasiatica FSC147]MBK2078481.1 lipocalin family protein [Francisella tularensis subsp. mediasiatica]MBK2102353.1 lipocalin family protein [Francisella tularensis subsp. mediasiatica]MBK2104093.1 lipocalin family protein [Francisella tularensis subsp. mediasiatica]MDN9003512.1 lipocalin family protein [Francisella tularensis subsp. mediasiatica]
MKKLVLIILTTAFILLSGCVTKPANINPVENFQADKYLGKWYEIARFDNSFEKGMTNVYAEYSLNPDGTIKVINSGITPSTGKRSYATGIANFVEDKNIGYLKVSFFRPFYGAYVVFELDDNYKYAYVAGADKDYLWLLARTKTVPQNIKDDFINRAKALGYATDKLVWVKQ